LSVFKPIYRDGLVEVASKLYTRRYVLLNKYETVMCSKSGCANIKRRRICRLK